MIGYVEKHGTVYAKAVAAAEEGYPMPQWSEPGPLVRVVRDHAKLSLRDHRKMQVYPASCGFGLLNP